MNKVPGLEYELAKSLKEKGFNPQQQWRSFYNATGLYTSDLLSQLIEGCGGEIKIYNLENDFTHWVADHQNPFATGHGGTPEEAVAKLWIALNVK